MRTRQGHSIVSGHSASEGLNRMNISPHGCDRLQKWLHTFSFLCPYSLNCAFEAPLVMETSLLSTQNQGSQCDLLWLIECDGRDHLPLWALAWVEGWGAPLATILSDPHRKFLVPPFPPATLGSSWEWVPPWILYPGTSCVSSEPQPSSTLSPSSYFDC